MASFAPSAWHDQRNRDITVNTSGLVAPGHPTPRVSLHESDMTSIKKTRRAAVRRLKSVVSLCFLSLLHMKTPHAGCPSQYNHTTRMSGSFESQRSDRRSGSFDSRRVSTLYGSFGSRRTSKASGIFDSPRISKVYGGYESRRVSRLICKCPGHTIVNPDPYNLLA